MYFYVLTKIFEEKIQPTMTDLLPFFILLYPTKLSIFPSHAPEHILSREHSSIFISPLRSCYWEKIRRVSQKNLRCEQNARLINSSFFNWETNPFGQWNRCIFALQFLKIQASFSAQDFLSSRAYMRRALGALEKNRDVIFSLIFSNLSISYIHYRFNVPMFHKNIKVVIQRI